MSTFFSFIFAHRNRDTARIKASFVSLARQESQNFEVIFVDYGSESERVNELEELCRNFIFVKFYHLQVPQLLWNKSKALNFGILKAGSPYIFIADVDLIFHPGTTTLFEKLAAPEKFYLFNLGHLEEKESIKIKDDFHFEDLSVSKFVAVNGMILVSKNACIEVNGLDEFFHFYGAEDVDLFGRLENAGYKRNFNKDDFFYHNWHKSFIGSEDRKLTQNPRVNNIMRINERHYLRNMKLNLKNPLNQEGMGETIDPMESTLLDYPTRQLSIQNKRSHVEHFLFEELPSSKGEILKVEFREDPFYRSWKYKLKINLGKRIEPYYSLKEVNDILLKTIIFCYRNHNYSFEVQKDPEAIIFRIKL